jgi:hypothetical protein
MEVFMSRVLWTVSMSVLLVGGLALAQESKEAPKAKGTLPQNWSRLGLTDKQKQEVYTIQTEYRTKIDELQRQIDKLRKDEQAALAKVLDDKQKTRLREILTEKVPGASESKPPEKR